MNTQTKPQWLQALPQRENYFYATGSVEFGHQDVETGRFDDDAYNADLREYFNRHLWIEASQINHMKAKFNFDKPITVAKFSQGYRTQITVANVTELAAAIENSKYSYIKSNI